jgi:hypothetical protein
MKKFFEGFEKRAQMVDEDFITRGSYPSAAAKGALVTGAMAAPLGAAANLWTNQFSVLKTPMSKSILAAIGAGALIGAGAGVAAKYTADKEGSQS